MKEMARMCVIISDLRMMVVRKNSRLLFLAFVCFDGGGCYAAAAMDVRKGIATPAATEQPEELSFTRRYSVVPPTTSSITDLNVLLRSTGNFGGCGFTGGGIALAVFPLPPSPFI